MYTIARGMIALVTTFLYVTVDIPVAIFTKGNI